MERERAKQAIRAAQTSIAQKISAMKGTHSESDLSHLERHLNCLAESYRRLVDDDVDWKDYLFPNDDSN